VPELPSLPAESLVPLLMLPLVVVVFVLSDFVFEVELPLVLVAFFLPTFFFPTISLPIEIDSMAGTNNKESISLRSPITAGHTNLLFVL
jgi:hypothetical protein